MYFIPMCFIDQIKSNIIMMSANTTSTKLLRNDYLNCYFAD